MNEFSSASESAMFVVTEGGTNCRQTNSKTETCFWFVCCPGYELTARFTVSAKKKTNKKKRTRYRNNSDMLFWFVCFCSCMFYPTNNINKTKTLRPTIFFYHYHATDTTDDKKKKSNYSVPIRDARHSLPCCLKIQPGKNTREKRGH